MAKIAGWYRYPLPKVGPLKGYMSDDKDGRNNVSKMIINVFQARMVKRNGYVNSGTYTANTIRIVHTSGKGIILNEHYTSIKLARERASELARMIDGTKIDAKIVSFVIMQKKKPIMKAPSNMIDGLVK